MMNGETVMIVSTMRNEGPYILEWVAHHAALGVDEFLIFTNDCDDHTDEILSRLGRTLRVRQVPNPKTMFPDRGNWQVMAQRFARKFGDYQAADWIYHTDADEFLQIRTSDRTLDSFYSAAADQAGDFHAVSFTSVPFSSAGEKALDARPVQTRYTRMNKHYAAHSEGDKPLINAVKTMFRNDVEFDLRRNHRPYMTAFSAQGLTWVDGSGNALGPEYTDTKFKAINATTSTKLAQMNHYAIKCAEAYLIKLDRGDVVGSDRLGRDTNYWTKYNASGDETTEYATLSPQAQTLFDQFLADPALARLHQKALEVHQGKIAAMKQDPEWCRVAGLLGLDWGTDVVPTTG